MFAASDLKVEVNVIIFIVLCVYMCVFVQGHNVVSYNILTQSEVIAFRRPMHNLIISRL